MQGKDSQINPKGNGVLIVQGLISKSGSSSGSGSFREKLRQFLFKDGGTFFEALRKKYTIVDVRMKID